MKKSRILTSLAGLLVLLVVGSCLLAACGDSTVIPAATTPPATTALTTTLPGTTSVPASTVSSTSPTVSTTTAGLNATSQSEIFPLNIQDLKEVKLDPSVEVEFAKAYPRFKNVAIRAYLSPQDSQLLFKQTVDAFMKAGYINDNKFYGQDNLFVRPTDQLDTNDIRLAYPGRPDVALGATSLKRTPASIARVLNVPGFNAANIEKLSDQFKDQKTILLLVYADNLFGDKPTPAPITPKPTGTAGQPTPTPSPRVTATDIVITAPPTTVGLVQPFQMPKVDGLTEINASAAVRNYFLKALPGQNVTLRLYGSRPDAITSATALDKAIKQNGYEFALNGYQELLKQGEGDKTTLAGLYRHANQEGVLFAIINLPADRSQLTKHLSINDLNASDEALLRSQLNGYSSFLVVVSSPDIVKTANGSLNVPTPTDSPNTYPK